MRVRDNERPLRSLIFLFIDVLIRAGRRAMCGFEQGRTGASHVTQVKCQNPSIHKIQQLRKESGKRRNHPASENVRDIRGARKPRRFRNKAGIKVTSHCLTWKFLLQKHPTLLYHNLIAPSYWYKNLESHWSTVNL